MAAPESESYYEPPNSHILNTLNKLSTGSIFRRQAERALSRSKPFVRSLALQQELKGHRGCVNTVSWSGDGQYLVSSGDDTDLMVWSFQENLALKHTSDSGHSSNVFCALFVPHHSNRNVISCARDGHIRLTDMERDITRCVAAYPRSIHKLRFLPHNPDVFLSGGSDGTVRYFDLRVDGVNRVNRSDLSNIVVDLRARCLTETIDVNNLSIHPLNGHILAVAGDDKYVRMFDLRMNFNFSSSTPALSKCVAKLTAPEHMHSKDPQFDRMHITGVAFNHNGTRLVATYSQGDVYVFDATTCDISLRLDTTTTTDDCSAVTLNCGKKQIRAAARMAGVRYNEMDNEANDEEEQEHALDETPYLYLARREDKTVDKLASQLRIAEGIEKAPVISRCTGHVNVQTIKEVTFYGVDSQWVMSGSDKGANPYGSIFVWDANTGQREMILHNADCMTVNCISANPSDDLTFASCGIDDTVKIWSPSGRTYANCDKEAEDQVLKGNRRRVRVTGLRELLARYFPGIASANPSENEDEEDEDDSDASADTSSSGEPVDAATLMAALNEVGLQSLDIPSDDDNDSSTGAAECNEEEEGNDEQQAKKQKKEALETQDGPSTEDMIAEIETVTDEVNAVTMGAFSVEDMEQSTEATEPE